VEVDGTWDLGVNLAGEGERRQGKVSKGGGGGEGGGEKSRNWKGWAPEQAIDVQDGREGRDGAERGHKQAERRVNTGGLEKGGRGLICNQFCVQGSAAD
jgi:hypothetical protein